MPTVSVFFSVLDRDSQYYEGDNMAPNDISLHSRQQKQIFQFLLTVVRTKNLSDHQRLLPSFCFVMNPERLAPLSMRDQ